MKKVFLFLIIIALSTRYKRAPASNKKKKPLLAGKDNFPAHNSLCGS